LKNKKLETYLNLKLIKKEQLYPNGNLEFRANYKNKILIKNIKWDNNGNLIFNKKISK
jgi:antitoxin component YwqK of YwqJK toxin-antitoxin module